MSRLPKIKLYGYCEKNVQEIHQIAVQGYLESLKNLDGEYTIVIESAGACTIITSPIGALQYFYFHRHDNLFHADTVLEVLRQANLPWRWNWEALGDLCQLENLTSNQTLHPDIRRVPPGCVLKFKDNKLSIDASQYIDSIPDEAPNPDNGVRAINEEVARWSEQDPYLSLSGGFDSRVILSSLLKQGFKPHLITMGNSDCSDVQVARSIAQKYSLKHDLIALDLNDFQAHADSISKLTNGTKLSWHWHTYLYPLKANIPASSPFFVGTLGEFARSYYFDKGKLGFLANLNPTQALNSFWKLKLNRHSTFEQNELTRLSPLFQEQLSRDGLDSRIKKLTKLCHSQFLQGLTRFYFEQRVPNFYGNGIKMYLSSSRWRSPFHSRQWISSMWNLPFRWKLGSNWHRYAIYKNFPSLLQFPEENGFNKTQMMLKAPPLYWSKFMRRTPYITYDQSDHWYNKDSIQQFIVRHTSLIDDLVDPELVFDIIKAHQESNKRTRTLAFLITMIYWKKNISEAI